MFIIAPNWKQLKYAQLVKWIKKILVIDATEYYSATAKKKQKKNKKKPKKINTWCNMNHTNIPNESRMQKSTQYMNPLI